MSFETATALADAFKVLADATRVRLLSALTEGERCVHDLCEVLGLQQSTVSHQLRLLRARQLVGTRRAGRHIYYSLEDTHVRDLLSVARAHHHHLETEEETNE